MSSQHTHDHDEQDNGEEEYLQQDEFDSEEVVDLGEGEPMEESDDDDMEEENPLEGYDVRQSETDENLLELADDSVQGFFDHREPVYAVAMHPKDNNIIASGGGDDKSYLWRADNGEKLFELTGHTDSVTAVAFSVEGDYVASAGMDGRVRVWKVENGELCASVEGPDEVVVRSNQGHMPTGKFMNIFNGHAGPVTAGRFTPDGKKIVSVSEDTSMIIWDPKSAVAEYRLSGDDARFHPEPITSMAVNKDSSLVISGSMDGKARLVNISNGSIVASLENHTESIETADFCDVLALAATGSVDGTISIWDVQTQRLRSTLSHEDAIIKVKFVHNSPLLVSCSADRNVKMWDARTGVCVKSWQGHRDAVLDIDVSSDGQTVVTASDDGACLVYKL
ncbi:hypothetical protein [Absidia glauca]|uniref:Uncharacterized protein n=1 Tax=Absidia glauca TaxID=4829 RepID=A0A163MF30_ABSGL|nr:hypothetical protein [Absidia glauca]